MAEEQELLEQQPPEWYMEWYITSQASFWDHSRRERPGIQLPFSGEFDWAGSHWVVPGVYSCGKALVVDFCRQVEPEAMESFMEKWGLTPGNDDTRNFTKEEALRLEVESPMSFSFHPTALVNGKEFRSSRGSAVGYLPLAQLEATEQEGYWAARHYGLDLSKAWHIWRFSFPWNRRREVDTLSFEMKAERARLPGPSFQIQPGEQVELTHPVTGENMTLTAQGLQRETLGDLGFPDKEGWEIPSHCWKLSYTLEPPMKDFSLEDVLEGDQMRPKAPKEGEILGWRDRRGFHGQHGGDHRRGGRPHGALCRGAPASRLPRCLFRPPLPAGGAGHLGAHFPLGIRGGQDRVPGENPIKKRPLPVWERAFPFVAVCFRASPKEGGPFALVGYQGTCSCFSPGNVPSTRAWV